MVDSDIHSWYDWRQGDDINKLHGRNGAQGNLQLMNTHSLHDLTSDDSEKMNSGSNEMQYSAIPSARSNNTEVRFINPAIYAETLNNEELEHDVEIRVKVSTKNDGQMIDCGDSAKVNDMMSTLAINNDLGTSYMDHAGDQGSAQETYRCYSFNAPSTSSSTTCCIVRSKSMASCRPSSRVERRCKIDDDNFDNDNELCSARQMNAEMQRYTFNGQRVVQVATSSLSSIRISDSRPDELEVGKKISYNEWVRRKQEMARQKKDEEDQVVKKKQMETEKLAREKMERESRERENFLKWAERKKKEEEKKKAVVVKELKLQKQLKQVEDKAAVVKTMCLRQWERKKKEEEKVRQQKEEMKQKQQEEERKKRLQESTKAYENWRKMARNKPKPATQGLLPHQKAKPAYVNPTPWQRIIDDPEDND